MSRSWLVLASFGSLAVAALGFAQKPAAATASKENIEAALKLTLAAAAEYEVRVGTNDRPLELRREPVLQWSNPDRGEIHGNVFLWTRDGRPLLVGSLFKWFTPFTHMAHEFHSLAEEPLSMKFHGKPTWSPTEPGVRFVDAPGPDRPARNEAQRLFQSRQLAREFSGIKKERDDTKLVQLRLLPQPIYRYAAPKQGIQSGALFAFVHGTDPEIFLLIEARGKGEEDARWQLAITRMTSSEVRLRHKDREVWAAETMLWKDVNEHKLPYTSFMFKEIPDFLKGSLPHPRP